MIEIIFKYIKLAEEILYIFVNVVCICIMAKTLYESILLQIHNRGSEARKKLIKGINVTLTFNLACEVLDIIVSRVLIEVAFVGSILVLKLLIAFLLHCEDKWEYERECHKTKKKSLV